MGTWHFDFSAGQGHWSPECAALLGATNTAFTGDEWIETVHADDRERAYRRWLRAVQEGGRFEIDFRPKSSGNRWLLARGRIEQGDGATAKAAGVLIDVTERRVAEVAHAASEAKAQDLLATLDLSAFMACDLDGTIRHWSIGCQELYGWSAAEAINQNAHVLLATRFPVPLSEIETALQRHGKWSGEVGNRTRDGRDLCVLANSAFRREANGARRVLISLTDVTARNQAEAEFRGTFEQAAVGMAHVELDGRWRKVNRRLCEMLGYSEAELLARTVQDVTHPDDCQAGLHEMQLLLEGRLETCSVEMRYVRKDGSLIWIHRTVALLRDRWGAPRFFISVIEDISPRKATEHRLTESRNQLRLALDAGRMGLWNWNLKTDQLHWDRRQFELFGVDPQRGDPSGAEVLRAVHPDDLPALRAAIEAAIAGENGGDFSAEFRIVQPDGGVRWKSSQGHVVSALDGSPERMIGLSFDVTERRETAEVLAREAAHLEELAEIRAQALAQSELRLAEAARMEALGRLAGGIAHDFNNILQAVQVRVQAADMMISDGSRAKEHLTQAVAAVRRGAAVTGRLLAFARRGDLSAEPVSPTSLLEETAAMLRPTLGPQHPVNVDAGPDLPPISADRRQLEAVLVNLANNARDAMPGGGTVTLRADSRTVPDPAAPGSLTPGAYICIAVLDQGEGMPAEVLARVTEPFFTTKALGKGTGLGLAMARGFAEQSGGALQIKSEPQHGTTVALWLPRSAVDAANPQSTTTSSESAAGSLDKTSRPSLLLAEDDDDIREVLAEILEEAGFAVAVAEHGQAAVELLDSGLRPNVLVTDFSMPGELDGLSLAAEVRRRLPRLPTVLVTGHAGAAPMDRMASIEQGGPFALMRKPVSAKTLIERIERVVRQGSGWRAAG